MCFAVQRVNVQMPLMELIKIISFRTTLHTESRATRHKLLGPDASVDAPPAAEKMTMHVYRLAIPMFLGWCLAAFADCAPEATAVAQETGIPPSRPGTARVWLLRPSGSVNGNVVAAAAGDIREWRARW